MAYTAKDLYLNGLARLGLNFPDGLVGETNAKGVYTILTGALTEFYLTHDWDFLLTSTTVTTAVGTAAYSLPSDLNNVYGAYISSLACELKVTQTRSAYVVGSAQGVPRFYTVNNGSITFLPTPGAVYSVTVPYYKTIAHPNAADQGGSGLYTYLATISYASLIPEWAREIAELYVAKNAALLLKDREAYGLTSDRIADLRKVLDDNVRKSTAPVPPQTRWDWNQ